MNEEDLISTAELIAWGAVLMMSILIAVSGWLYRRLVSVDDGLSKSIDNMKDDLHKIRLHVSETYMPRDEIGKRLDGIETKLDRLLNKK